MADYFDDAISRTLQHEGGYVNDPDDPGGETNYGISAKAFPDVDIENLTAEEAIDLYRRLYWVAPGLWRIADLELACKVFDLGVNVGTSTAIRWLQQAVNCLGGELVIDGLLGPKTEAAVNDYPHQEALLSFVKYLAVDHYFHLHLPRYLAGWLNRLES